MPFLIRNHGDAQQVCVAPRSGDAALRLRLTDESVAVPKSSDGGKSTPIADLTINEVLNRSIAFFPRVHPALHMFSVLYSGSADSPALQTIWLGQFF